MIHPLNIPVVALPQQFTNPFCYTPHPLCIAAADEVKAFLRQHAEWKEEIDRGKMFGVLVVEQDGRLCFLAAFSGLLAGSNNIPYFVPPIYDLLDPDSRFQREQTEISEMNEQINALEVHGNADTFPSLYTQEERAHIAELKRTRKARSIALQDWLFEQYVCLNARGERKSMTQVFVDFYRDTMLHLENFQKNARSHHIPSGSGECCAPKLLQYAYLNGLRPLCMAEFWMGDSPKEEVRYEGEFYPACRKKCRPILHFMLQGLDVEVSRLEIHNARLLQAIEVIYEDADLLVINKPGGLLSVPSRESQCSVVDWLIQRYQQDSASVRPVHRLDQDTSGILLIAKNQQSLRRMNKAFVQHEVKKAYVAVLQGNVPDPKETDQEGRGVIRLPLRPNPDDAPRQMVDMEHGKQAITRYQVMARKNGYTLVRFFPETGRTHQLRVHSAHLLGLGCPIVGDRLYAPQSSVIQPPASFLHLHAASIDFVHPTTGRPMHFDCPPPFTLS